MPQILDSSTKCWVYVQSWFRIYIQIYITVPTQNKSLQKYPSDSFFSHFAVEWLIQDLFLSRLRMNVGLN